LEDTFLNAGNKKMNFKDRGSDKGDYIYLPRPMCQWRYFLNVVNTVTTSL